MRLAAAAAVLLALSCNRVEPSRTPLSPPVARTDGRTLPSSSRALEGTDDTEDRNEMEIVIAPSDDDDDGTARSSKPSSISSSRASKSAASLDENAGRAVGSPLAGRAVGSPLAGGPAPDVCSAPAGPPPDCSALAPASSCLGASIAQRTCEKLGPIVDPRVGAAWMTCMRDPAGSACDSHRIVDCGLRAVDDACVDGTYHAFCEQIATSCSDVAEQITAKVCERLIAAWKPERRSQMIECLRHGCETGAFGVCLP